VSIGKKAVSLSPTCDEREQPGTRQSRRQEREEEEEEGGGGRGRRLQKKMET